MKCFPVIIFYAHVSSQSQDAVLSSSLPTFGRFVTNLCDIEWRSCARSFDNVHGQFAFCKYVDNWKCFLLLLQPVGASCMSSIPHRDSQEVQRNKPENVHVQWSYLQMLTYFKIHFPLHDQFCVQSDFHWEALLDFAWIGLYLLPLAWLTHLAQDNKR